MTISVCMPYYNREKELIRGIESILKHNPTLDLKFSITCDRSRPPLSYSCFSPAYSDLVRINWIQGTPEPRNPCKPINLAVNRAIKHQDPDLIVLTGPEITHTEQTITHMVDLYRAIFDDPAVDTPLLSYITANCYDKRGKIAGAGVDYTKDGRLPVPEGAHFHFLAMFSPELWEKAGGFDPDYRNVQGCDDNDWLWRCHKAGARFYCVDSAVWHEVSTTKWNMPHGRDLFYEKWPELKS